MNGFIVHGAVLNSSKEQIGELYAETQAETTRRFPPPKHRRKRWNSICVRPVRWEYPQQATSSCAHFNAAVDAALAAAAAKAALRRDVVVWAELESWLVNRSLFLSCEYASTRTRTRHRLFAAANPQSLLDELHKTASFKEKPPAALTPAFILKPSSAAGLLEYFSALFIPHDLYHKYKLM